MFFQYPMSQGRVSVRDISICQVEINNVSQIDSHRSITHFENCVKGTRKNYFSSTVFLCIIKFLRNFLWYFFTEEWSSKAISLNTNIKIPFLAKSFVKIDHLYSLIEKNKFCSIHLTATEKLISKPFNNVHNISFYKKFFANIFAIEN